MTNYEKQPFCAHSRCPLSADGKTVGYTGTSLLRDVAMLANGFRLIDTEPSVIRFAVDKLLARYKQDGIEFTPDFKEIMYRHYGIADVAPSIPTLRS